MTEQSPAPSLADSSRHARKPWLALLLALVSTPLAFIYVGRLALGVVLLVVLLGVAFVLGQAGLLQSYRGFWLLIVVGTMFFGASIGLPWWFARKQRIAFTPRWYNRWWGYLLGWLIMALPFYWMVEHREQVFGYASYRIPSGSMEPTVARGDMVVVDTRASTLAALKNGDLVITESTERPGQLYLRRIVAMGGQHVLIDEDGTRVDGVLQPRDHLQGSDIPPRMALSFADVQLEPDQLYLMGDNRGNSLDSRWEGPSERNQLRAKVTAIWWSESPGHRGDLPKP